MPALTLLLITPILTELLTGNTPAPGFFMPRIFAALMLFYGVPAILARDLYIRWDFRLPGLLLLGLAYGIFNEGVLAKTLIMNHEVPIGAFDGYAFCGINFPWTGLIVPWHALHSIIFPIAFVTWLFPNQARKPTLSRVWFVVVGIIISALGSLAYLGNKQKVTPSIYLDLFIAVIATLILAAVRLPRGKPFLEPAPPANLSPAAVGFTFYPVVILAPTFLCAFKAPGLVVIALSITILALYYRLAVRRGWLGLRSVVLFGLGSYLAGSTWSCLFFNKHKTLVMMAPSGS